MLKVTIFASGRGSNALSIIEYSHTVDSFEVALICSNNSSPGVFDHANTYGIPTMVFTKEDKEDGNELVDKLADMNIELIVLAGYMKKIPQALIDGFEDRMLNIHPALLPKFGGKGMYGMHVHEAVVASGEKKSGISVHLVNEEYDEGKILFQAEYTLKEGETAESLAKGVLELEHLYYPQVVANYAEQLST